ncbi:MAG TPA: ScpA family protein [Geminicoccaceae bacterium]
MSEVVPFGAPVLPAGFVVELDGFEGPIDLLLSLARDQKVDLREISILALADQYLAYIQQARDLQLEIAADYLVTAAWLAYLKSRLLLPGPPDDDEPAPEDLAQNLAARIRHLDAIRRAAGLLIDRPILGEQRFPRGRPEGLQVIRRPRFRLALHELLQAYVAQRLRAKEHRMVLTPAPVMRMEDALQLIVERLGGPDWQNLLAFLPEWAMDERQRRAAIAASFAATLELARAGTIEIAQAQPFGPILMRRR